MWNDGRHARRTKLLIGVFSALSFAPRAAPQSGPAFQGLSLEDLLNTHITIASKANEKSSDAPGIITVVTKDELRRFGGTTLKDVLERAAGLIGSSIYMTDRSTVAARGDQIQPSSSHVLFLINGRPVREVLEGGVKSELYETFPVDAIERIEIIKGPGSVLYGSNAFSAVINVVTVKAEGQRLSLTALGGESGAYGGSASATVKRGDFSLVAAGRYLQKAEWTTDYVMADATTRAPTAFPITIPNKGPGAFLDLGYKNLRIMSAFNQWDHAYFIPDFQALGGATWQKVFTDVGYGWQARKSWHTDFNVTYTRSTFEVSAFPNIKRNAYELLAEWSNFITPSAKSRLSVGGLYSKSKGGETFYGLGFPIPISNGDRNSFGLYAQANYLLTPGVDVIAGLQANKTEGIDLGLVPRAGVVWHPVTRLTLKALYGRAFRSPSINEISLAHPQLRGNPDLKPEKVGTVDLSLMYQGEKAEGAINYFYARQTQIVFQNRTTAVPFYDNIPGAVNIHGFELEGKRYLNRAFFVSGSLLYQKSGNAAGEENLSPIAAFGMKTGLSYQSENGVTLSVSNIYQGSLDKKYDTLVNPSPGSYDMLNLHCAVNLKKALGLDLGRELEFVIQGDNLLNEEVWLPGWGLSPGSSIPYNQGRALYASLKLGL